MGNYLALILKSSGVEPNAAVSSFTLNCWVMALASLLFSFCLLVPEMNPKV